ncbi:MULTISPECIES: DUF551 domain-containing protein [unclassified Eikenella]|uniref:DUF551 domain-containing protein n=1 Tax=unclassified Eikenella TaxID=2639367 RepID=UPI0008A382CA|nr:MULTISPECIES: DUF551 domain-containing protein [unclassified Eikenella]OFK85208.1 hypothetical protein HMPREF2796_00715 [Eikenella sp. HMSC071B05]OFO43636.1 hypothetical protein HMPREF3043_10255 [Eikenella sp. HMSC073A11]
MTPERIEQERKAFEWWISNQAPPVPIDPCQKQKDGRYAYDHIEFAWRAWQARAAQSEWISVEDRLPEIDTTVLICTERGEIFSSWASNEEVFWFYGEEEDNRVTHWQPLPAPPTTNPAA